MAESESDSIDRYDKLSNVIFEAAIGSDSPNRVSEQIVTRESIENGAKVRRVQHIVSRTADIKLALQLLDQRIGGPQDWC